MERKKLVYNVMNDLWQMAQQEAFQKPKSEMTDDDWKKIVDEMDNRYRKYCSLNEKESAFAFEVLNALTQLIEREDKHNIEIKEAPSPYSTYKRVWVTKDQAKSWYGVNISDTN